MADSTTPKDEHSAPGWHAIDAVLKKQYGEQEPRHWGVLISYMLGGRDPLDGISAYVHDSPGSVSHWHYVSYGLSELYKKESENKDLSGFGFEFTFRLKRDPNQAEPPQWPLGFLQNLARYVFESGNVFAPGHYLPLNGPIAAEEKTEIYAAIFAEDPELGEIETPHGKVQFLQIVGATMDELSAAQAWDTAKFMEVARTTNPLLITDLARQSILRDPGAARTIAEGTERDGSSSGWLYVTQLEFEDVSSAKSMQLVTVGASAVEDIGALLRGRVGFGRLFNLAGPDTSLAFSAADTYGWDYNDEGILEISLPATAAKALASALRPLRGDYSVPEAPELVIRVVPTEIKDARGENIEQIIG